MKRARWSAYLAALGLILGGLLVMQPASHAEEGGIVDVWIASQVDPNQAPLYDEDTMLAIGQQWKNAHPDWKDGRTGEVSLWISQAKIVFIHNPSGVTGYPNPLHQNTLWVTYISINIAGVGSFPLSVDNIGRDCANTPAWQPYQVWNNTDYDYNVNGLVMTWGAKKGTNYNVHDTKPDGGNIFRCGNNNYAYWYPTGTDVDWDSGWQMHGEWKFQNHYNPNRSQNANATPYFEWAAFSSNACGASMTSGPGYIAQWNGGLSCKVVLTGQVS